MSTSRFPYLLLVSICLLLCDSLALGLDADTPWVSVSSSDGSVATARHEASAVAVGDNLYLLGGRGNRPLEIFDTINRTWRDLGRAPIELHHFQPVVIGQKIYALGAFTCCYPNEPSVAEIYVFDTVTEQWSTDGVIPEARRRGAAAAVVHNGDIYLLGGNTLGHNGGAVPWLDRYDPDTGDWQVLADAPNARDHFAAAVINGQLVAAAGRRTVQPNPFVNPVLPTDVYDIEAGNWISGAQIPTARAGTMIATAENELLVAGGEINTTSQALRTTEAYNVLTNQWRSLQPMIDQRHSGGGAVVNNIWHVVAGSEVQGGPLSGEINRHETLDLTAMSEPEDSDDDGLSDVDETGLHNTNPNDPDSDDDELLDGMEVTLGTDPLNADTDSDGLDDGDEFDRGTDYFDADSDDDELDDGLEVSLGSDPLQADSDSDQLPDGAEYLLGTNLLDEDSDDDGLNDGAEVDNHGTDPLLSDTDSDDLSDFAEITLWLTNPIVADTDDDGLSDGAEIALGTKPDDADSDEDGLLDGAEVASGTDPLKRDSDGDGLGDAQDPEPLVAVGEPDAGGKKNSGLGATLWYMLAMGVVALSRTTRKGVNKKSYKL